MKTQSEGNNPTNQLMTTEQLLAHWQGHRSLTRKTIEAFPEKELFSYSLGGMRPFSALAMELLAIAEPGLREIVTGKGNELNEHLPDTTTKADILKRWDEATAGINKLWPALTYERFPQQIVTFGQYPGTVLSSLLYFIDNEIHHRGQGYVYLRALGIEPPAFWDRP